MRPIACYAALLKLALALLAFADPKAGVLLTVVECLDLLAIRQRGQRRTGISPRCQSRRSRRRITYP